MIIVNRQLRCLEYWGTAAVNPPCRMIAVGEREFVEDGGVVAIEAASWQGDTATPIATANNTPGQRPSP
jgi:hypothetical protein